MSATHMPTPGPEHAVLARLAGTWEGPETMQPSPWSPAAETRHGRSESRVFEGFFVVSEYVQRAGDAITFRGHGVYSFDPADKKYVMYWFDSMGGAGGVARGTMDGNVLTFLNASPMGHHRYRYTFGDGTLRFDMALSKDGTTWTDLMNAAYKKA